jgi:signal transduction histidine kinase
MAQIPFTVSARTARLIGRENVANAEGAIIELVKNCYDADADFALVLINPTKRTIIIYDNGTGMSEKDIKGNWMNIGTDNKENNFRSEKGRIKAGAKGIGRFALDRLGEKCTMYTLQKSNKDGFKWSTNWNDFEKSGTVIGNVFADLSIEKNLTLSDIIKKETSNPRIIKVIEKNEIKRGTILKIEVARDEWNEDLSDKILHSLEILTPPDGQNKFEIFFFNESFNTKFGKIENESFSDYDYKITATYEKNKEREIRIDFHRNEFDFNLIDSAFFEREAMKLFPYDKRTFKKQKFSIISTFYELVPGFKEKDKKNLSDTIGDFSFTLYYFKLGSSEDNAEKFKYKSFNSTIRRKWASKFGGIKLFRDNFRVRPYGEISTASYDWLMLGERQGKNPAGASRAGDFHIKPNQVAGTIDFSRVSKLFLDDKSGREGLIENDTFVLFKNILTGIISELETDRSTIAENLSDYYKEVNFEDQEEEKALEIIDSASTQNESADETKKQNRTLKNAVRSQKKKIDQKDEELVLSRAMASAGILIASFSHEFHLIKNKLNSRATNLKNALVPILPEERLKNTDNRNNPYYLINQIKELDDKIKQWIEFSIMLTRKDRRTSKKISLLVYFNEFKINWKKKLADRGTALNISSTGKVNDFYIKIIELDLDTIFDNLVSNSLDAFQRNGFKGNRIININLSRTNEQIEIEYTDSGPGISKDIKKNEDIFKAFVTTKRDNTGKEIGTGLGMWLLKSSIDYNKGEAKLYNPEKGFQIKIYLNPVK